MWNCTGYVCVEETGLKFPLQCRIVQSSKLTRFYSNKENKQDKKVKVFSCKLVSVLCLFL